MVVFYKFVSKLEADRLIELGGLEGYKRSEDVGEAQADGTYTSVQSTGRTSPCVYVDGFIVFFITVPEETGEGPPSARSQQQPPSARSQQQQPSARSQRQQQQQQHQQHV
jgi:hypothetical protein